MFPCSTLAAMLISPAVGASRDAPDPYTVEWDSPSGDSSGSMPLGNGDLGLNVWVERGGDLLLYVSKTDAWCENGRLLKLGRVRVTLSPTPFRPGAPFRQTLDLRSGCVTVTGGQGSSKVELRLWVDANAPVVRLDVRSASPVALGVSLETWRAHRRALVGEELDGAYGLSGGPTPVTADPDTVVADGTDRLLWYHHNSRSIWTQNMEQQGMAAWTTKAADPLARRTFGCLVRGPGLARDGSHALRSAEVAKAHTVALYALTTVDVSAESWTSSIEEVASADTGDLGGAWRSHASWWQAFWERSWIRLSAKGSLGERLAEATRDYNLQRFVSACAGRGGYPIKFNGSLFTVDAIVDGVSLDADYRKWGGPYWFQNTRLAYWPQLASGDSEMMLPLFRMYLDALPFAQARTRAFFGHGGAFFPETMYFWGAYTNDNFGWDRTGKPAGIPDNAYIRYYYSGALELSVMMLDHAAHTEDTAFLTSRLLPFIDEILEFYARHYPRDPAGKLRIEPSQALETWQKAVNPLPPIAGLRFLCERLLSLSVATAGETRRARWTALLREVPYLPTSGAGEAKVLAPAGEVLDEARNSENPELYAIFPYRLCGIGKPDLEVARRTFEQRRVKDHTGWRQDEIQAAYLGLAREASQGLLERLATRNPQARFPVFWGPNFDWVPDQDHGTSALMALQCMLLQADGRSMLLFPAWPREWDVEFRLHAPFGTTVQGAFRDGRLVSIAVTPEERRADLVVREPQ